MDRRRCVQCECSKRAAHRRLSGAASQGRDESAYLRCGGNSRIRALYSPTKIKVEGIKCHRQPWLASVLTQTRSCTARSSCAGYANAVRSCCRSPGPARFLTWMKTSPPLRSPEEVYSHRHGEMSRGRAMTTTPEIQNRGVAASAALSARRESASPSPVALQPPSGACSLPAEIRTA
jgi:hypothetical protein